ncbi:MAG: serine hydrolase domain-containing protein, partial [Acidimicrobiales bacterium]
LYSLTVGVDGAAASVTPRTRSTSSTTSATTSAATAAPSAGGALTSATIPVTGAPVATGMKPWITAAEKVMRTYHLPGASLAVAFEGRVVLEEGLGYADVAAKAPVEPDSIFRLASVSKSITATLVGMLINEHKLALSTRPFATVLSALRGPHGTKPVDPRLQDITVGDLLIHAGGWDDTEAGYTATQDPGPEEAALGLHTDPTCEQAIEYMLGVRLNFTPGTKYAYSNFGYCVLADTIAHVTHMTYANAAKSMLFAPLHMEHTALSPANPATLLPGEAHFYGQGDQASGPDSPSEFSLYTSEGCGNWTSTAPDLERFLIATAATTPGSSPFPNWAQVSIAGQSIPGVSPYPSQQGPDPSGQGTYWNFDGALPGTATEVGVFGPITYVMLTNSQEADNTTNFAPLQQLAEKETTAPASSWPNGELLSPPPVVNTPAHQVER